MQLFIFFYLFIFTSVAKFCSYIYGYRSSELLNILTIHASPFTLQSLHKLSFPSSSLCSRSPDEKTKQYRHSFIPFTCNLWDSFIRMHFLPTMTWSFQEGSTKTAPSPALISLGILRYSLYISSKLYDIFRLCISVTYSLKHRTLCLTPLVYR